VSARAAAGIAVLLLVATSTAGSALAQVPADTLGVPADTVLVEPPQLPSPVPADTVVATRADTVVVAPGEPERARPARPVVPLPAPIPGPALTGVPARLAAFGLTELLREHPGAFLYELGVTGAPHGLSFGGLPPHRLALSLDGRPADDLFTGRPAFERLPEDLLAPLVRDPARFDGTDGVQAQMRAFQAAVPITEIRYRTGPDGLRFVGVTHAQTRRPAFVQRLGGDRARLVALAHVGGEAAQGQYTNAGVEGWQLVARVGLALPTLAIEVTERHHRRTEGAWGGVLPEAPSPFALNAPVVDPTAERTTVQNDLSATVHVPVLETADPLAVTAYWTASTHRHTAPDTLTEASADRVGLHVRQTIRVGVHRLTARLDAWGGRHRGGLAFAVVPSPYPFEAHVAVEDSVVLAGVELVATTGFRVGDTAGPTLRLDARLPLGPVALRAGARHGGVRLSPAERLGFGPRVLAEPVAAERLSALTAGLDAAVGPFSARADVEASVQDRPRELLVDAAGMGRFVSADGSFRRVTASLGLGFRDTGARGVYATAQATAYRFLNAGDSDLHRRAAEALPELWGSGRLGVRAPRMFGGSLDADLYVRARGWPAFRGRVLHAPTALFGLPEGPMPTVPARAVLDAVFQGGLGGGRATVFVAYENALAGVAYPGVYVVPVYPLARPALRVGLFWLLPN
jgi:hypothetical protein